mmetsp:Transcript_41807/g.63875  ORF Transcript_41807/g.63875 Transcript_41807/m.63875 type:complete len:136 (+) Transcript_41807:2016-2423(+)
MKPAPSADEANKQDADMAETPDDQKADSEQNPSRAGLKSAADSGAEDNAAEGDLEEDKKDAFVPDVIENDFLDKAALSPPQDPDGANTLYPDLCLTRDRIVEILEKALNTVMEWLLAEKKVYHQKCKAEGKTLQD